jgi:hypothetical protein
VRFGSRGAAVEHYPWLFSFQVGSKESDTGTVTKGWRTILLVAVAAAVVGGAGGVTTASFSDPTASSGNAFSAAATFGSCPAAGQTTVYADADAYVRQTTPTLNAGASNSIGVVSHYDSTNLVSANYRSVVRFPLPAVPAGCSVTAATMQLYDALTPVGRIIAAARAASAWTEGTVTWATQPATVGPDALAPSPAATFGPLQFDVLDHVEAMYAGANDGFVLRDSVEDAVTQNYQWMTSRESWPQLTVTFGGGGCSAPGATVVRSDADTWVDETQPAANFGDRGTMTLRSRKQGQTQENGRALVRFPLPTVPSGCSVTAASMRLGALTSAAGRTLQAFRAAAVWDEATVTWSTQPATTGVATTAPSGENPTFDVLTQVQAMYAGTNTGFLVRESAEGAGGDGHTQWFGAREGAPRLVLTLG